MSELSDQARALVEAGRTDRPSAEDRARLGAAMQARLAAPSPRVPKATVVGGVTVGGILLALAVWLAWPASVAPPPALVPAPAPAPKLVEAQPPTPELEVAPERSPPPSEVSVPPLTRRALHAAPPSPAPAIAVEPPQPASTLAEEMALLRLAQNALTAGQAGEALASLERHEARFPQGVLREERDAARVFALEALGRTGEACTRAASFLSATPRSPQAGRVRAFSAKQCAGQEK